VCIHVVSRREMAAESLLSPTPAPAAPLRVLLVEDNAADAMVAQAAIQKAAIGRAEVLRADTLSKALAIAGSTDVHLVLLDLNLPDSRGLLTLERMRASVRCPVIVVTAAEHPGMDEEALEMGAFEILHKGGLRADGIARMLRLAEGQRKVQASLEGAELRYRKLIEIAPDAIFVHTDGRIVLVNPAMQHLFGAGGPDQLLGSDVLELVVPAGREAARKRMQSLYAFTHSLRPTEVEYQRRDGTAFPAEVTAVSFTLDGRPATQVVVRDITERKEVEARLARLARYDPVTGLPNRNLLQERLEHAVTQSRRRHRGAGVLFVDLDRFKLVNDTYGHDVGDELLRLAGERLVGCVRQDDTVSRLGGDEYAVVIADLARPDDAALVAQKILDSFTAPFDLGGRETFITASIGVATFPNDGESAEALLKCADIAMYRAKESSRNAFCFYTAELNERATSKLQLNSDLRRALERGEFSLHYQPKVRLASGQMIGMEALLRWQHAERGMVPPLEFIPALEDSGLIVAVGDWVIEEACTQLAAWSRAELRPPPVAVNLSARQFRRRDLDRVIHALLARHGVSPELLELEITESSLMDDPKDAIRQLQALREAGLRISVDDFGTGYSSLAYLTRLPISTLKIDRSFVDAAITEPGSAAIVKMVIDMAQRLQFDVVAEGIETERHVDFLRQNGCEQGQGYHFGRPVPASAMTPRLK
jgi:diguanylate cyclase (GGDEF)-like protein/PAS domain S-box-containing protein